jgi:hypothetical protein
MLRHCSFLLLCFWPLYLLAQPDHPLSEIPAELSLSAKAYSFTDEEGLTLLFLESNQARLFLLNSQMQLERSYTFSNLPFGPNLEILGFTNRRDALHLYYRQQISDEYEVFTVQKADGQTRNFRLDLREKKRHLHAGAFTYQGTLHIVRMPRNSQMIRLCKFEEGGQFSSEDIKLRRTDFGEKTNYQLMSISPDSSLEMSDTYFSGKMYQYGPFLYLSLDEKGSTYLVSIDLATKRQRETVFPAPTFAQEPESKSNSLLWQDLLMQIGTTPDSLKLHIRDLRSGALMAAYQYGREERMDLTNGSMLTQSANGSTHAVPTTGEFLDLCAQAPHLAIAAQNLPDSLLVFVAGAVRPVQERGVSGIVISERFETVWFESQFDLLSLSPALPLATSPRWQRPRRKLPMEIRFEQNGRSLRGYYDVRTGKYRIFKD